jgi:uncharacterized RDD family membrane protein YckC
MPPGDRLTIETPEQTVLEFSLAGIGSRFLALAIDSLLQMAALILVGVVAGLIALAGYFPQVGKQWAYAILIFIAFLVEFGYFAFFETIWNGQTPGKRWTHLRVITDSGRPIDAQAAILRNLLRIVDFLPTLYATGIITSLISAQNKRAGDYVAGTVVVHEKPLQVGRALWDAPAAPLLTVAQPRDLTAAELELVEAFLERRDSLPDEVRRSMARQIAESVSQRAPVPQEALLTPEKFLEALAEQCRNTTRFR